MAAKGTAAKQALIKRFAAACGKDYLGSDGSKYYFVSEENGEKIQVALALTCPKTPFAGSSGGIDFEDGDAPLPDKVAMVASEEEKALLERLARELNL